MLYKKFLYSILVLTLPFVTMAKDTSITEQNSEKIYPGKTYTVRIIVPKAVVYADENMLIPIGYIANGKSIKVGNPRRINKDLVPLNVFGRIGYIEIKNISYDKLSDEDYFAKRGAPKEHNVDLVLPKPDEDFSIGNYLFLGMHQQAAGKNFQDTLFNIDGTETNSITGLSISAIHRMNTSSFFWGLGFDYNFISTPEIKFNYVMLTPIVGTNIRNKKYYRLDLLAGVDFSLSTDYKMSSIDLRETGGFIWGPSFGMRAILFPENRYQLYLNVLYKYYNVNMLNVLRDDKNNEIDGFTNISGTNLGIGLVINFN